MFGIFSPGKEVAETTYLALFALQHRGQQAAGIASFDDGEFYLSKGEGLIADVFRRKSLNDVKGDRAIGDVLYGKHVTNDSLFQVQPLTFYNKWGRIAIVSSGGLVNGRELKKKLSKTGSVFQGSSDSEVMAHLMARYGHHSIEEGLVKMMEEAKGAYSLLVLTKDKLIGLRDPHGIRPLCLGRLDGNYVLSSESCAFSAIGAEYVREVMPGEMIVIDENGYESFIPFKNQDKIQRHFCIFEYIYISRPDSAFDGRGVSVVRREMGRQLAREYSVDADIVIPVPDSGVACALGYSEESGIPYTLGLLKNRYIGRTFIQPVQEMRERGVQLKLNPVREELMGKKVIVVDDSIIRGTTSKNIIKMIREAGATEVHLIICSPPAICPCRYGINTKSDQLIARKKSVPEIREYIGADGLHFLSLEGMLESTGRNTENYCTACFSGEYIV